MHESCRTSRRWLPHRCLDASDRFRHVLACVGEANSQDRPGAVSPSHELQDHAGVKQDHNSSRIVVTTSRWEPVWRRSHTASSSQFGAGRFTAPEKHPLTLSRWGLFRGRFRFPHHRGPHMKRVQFHVALDQRRRALAQGTRHPAEHSALHLPRHCAQAVASRGSGQACSSGPGVGP